MLLRNMVLAMTHPRFACRSFRRGGMLTGMTARLVEVRHEPVVLVGLELSQPNYCAPAYLMPETNFSRSPRKPNTNTRKTMKQILTPFKILTTIALLALAIGCANTRSKENSLIAAGFGVSVPRLRRSNRNSRAFLRQGDHRSEHRKTYYRFPDAAHNLAYVGGPKEYETYRQLRSKQKLANEKLAAAEEKQEARQIEWGGWGS